MVDIANVSYAPLVFRAKPARDGAEGKIVEILPGKSAEVDIDADHVDVVARRDAGLIVVGTKAQAEKAAREAPVAVAADAGKGADAAKAEKADKPSA